MIDSQTSQAEEPASQAKLLQRILVVDDDILLRHLSREALKHSGYEVDAVEDGAAAWQALNTDRYDLLITDQNMPKVTGVELLTKLHVAHMVLPIIMTTGTVPNEEFTRSPWLQPAATLLKPYAIAALLGTVRKVLRANEAADEQIAPLPNWQSQPAPPGLRL